MLILIFDWPDAFIAAIVASLHEIGKHKNGWNRQTVYRKPFQSYPLKAFLQIIEQLLKFDQNWGQDEINCSFCSFPEVVENYKKPRGTQL